MIPQLSLDALVKAQGFALMGIADWMSQQPDVPDNVKRDLVNMLTAVPIIVGGDLGEEAEVEMKKRANTILERLIGTSAF